MLEALTVERTIWINAPRERVWQAITTAEQIRQWWGGDHWEISTLEIGGIIKFGDPDDLMTAIIEVLNPPEQFTIQWPPQMGYHSIAIYTTYVLEEESSGTQVTVRETGFEALPDDIRQQRFDSTSEGYASVLAGLKAFLEQETA